MTATAPTIRESGSQQAGFEATASAFDLSRTSQNDAREAFGCFIEAARQAHELLNQSADAMISGARDLFENAVQHTDEHLRLNFQLAQWLIESNDLNCVLDAQREFARETVETYGRQVQQLSRIVSRPHKTQTRQASCEWSQPKASASQDWDPSE
ncbi:MAG: phasin family protein [Rhodomicrobium sp.]